MTRDPEVVAIQKQWFTDYSEHKRWIIVEVSEGYELHIHDCENVWPVVTYPTKREVAARLLQLFHMGPVAPQIQAEKVQIGSVEFST